MPKTSISFRVPSTLWTNFKQQTDSLFLSRAPFLDHVLQVELKHLATDLDGIRLSSRTKRYIANKLPRLDPISVNIEVSASTAQQLREVMNQHNVVRDAFINRLIIFLRGEKYIFDDLEVPHRITDSGPWGKVGLPSLPTSPVLAMSEVIDDPLYYLRGYVQHRWGKGLYAIELPSWLDWAACTLPHERIVGSGAYNKEIKVKLDSPDFDLLDTETENA